MRPIGIGVRLYPFDVHVGDPVPERDVAVEQAELLGRCQLPQELVNEIDQRLTGPKTVHAAREGGRAVRPPERNPWASGKR